MSHTERISISIDNERADRIRELVKTGEYASVSSAFDAAADLLLAHQQAKHAWWEETLRRCDEAEKHPDKLLDPDTFFRNLRTEIHARKISGSKAG